MKLTKIIYMAAALLLTNNALAAASTAQEVQLLRQRIQLLESALQPADADALVKLYAEAVSKRNGAIQYMLFCPALQKKHLADFQDMNWVTGVSSPSVLRYDIDKKSNQKYAVNFSMGMQGKKSGTMTDILEIHEKGARVCISTYSNSEKD